MISNYQINFNIVVFSLKFYFEENVAIYERLM